MTQDASDYYKRAAALLENLRDEIGAGFGEGDIEHIGDIVIARLRAWDKLDREDVKRRLSTPPAPSVPVKALADAYQMYLDAVQLYNERHAIMKTKVLGTMRVDDEYKAIGVARRAFDKLAVDVATAALSAQVQDVAGAVEAFERDYPELYWHIAKGKITAGEPLYGAIITDLRGNELGDGESNVSAIDAFNIAVDAAALPAAPAKQEG